MKEANSVLKKLHAGPAVRKLVETAITLNNSKDPQQKNNAFGFMESAIKELEDDKDKINKINEEENDKDNNNEHKLHEEEISNHTPGSRTEGSEQSTDNKEPYPGEGKDSTSGEKPMQDMDNTKNQFEETDNGMIIPGLAPKNALEMGQDVKMPPMTTPQLMEQMRYTVNRMMEPLIKKQEQTNINLKESVKILSKELQEAKSINGNMQLDLDYMRKHSSATFRETTPSHNEQAGFDKFGLPSIQPVPIRQHKLQDARNEIEQMDKLLNNPESSIYQ